MNRKDELLNEISNLGGYVYEPERWTNKQLKIEIENLKRWNDAKARANR